jgi:hypothetical protein
MATIYFLRDGPATSQTGELNNIPKNSLARLRCDNMLYSISPPAFNGSSPSSDVADYRHAIVKVEHSDVTSDFPKSGYYRLTLSPSECLEVLQKIVTGGR